MNRSILLGCIALLAAGCSGKKKPAPEEPYFPALPFFQSEIRHVDTSVFRIIAVRTVNGRSDTQYIRREDFRKQAELFTTLPDITEQPEQYKETKMYDETTNEASFVYEATEPDLPVRKQIIYAQPTPGGEAHITRVYVEKVQDAGNPATHKMTWEAGKYFRIISIVPKEKGFEQIVKTEVLWNE
ncbi:MAG TPA: hypothetical protein VHK69_17705 [Chitinophagaceae bacterium]|jgi:hypothetical protein|nr:hypothetical protein [Chitinophagaceae bacterium]